MAQSCMWIDNTRGLFEGRWGAHAGCGVGQAVLVVVKRRRCVDPELLH